MDIFIRPLVGPPQNVYHINCKSFLILYKILNFPSNLIFVIPHISRKIHITRNKVRKRKANSEEDEKKTRTITAHYLYLSVSFGECLPCYHIYYCICRATRQTKRYKKQIVRCTHEIEFIWWEAAPKFGHSSVVALIAHLRALLVSIAMYLYTHTHFCVKNFPFTWISTVQNVNKFVYTGPDTYFSFELRYWRSWNMICFSLFFPFISVLYAGSIRLRTRRGYIVAMQRNRIEIPVWRYFAGKFAWIIPHRIFC